MHLSLAQTYFLLHSHHTFCDCNSLLFKLGKHRRDKRHERAKPTQTMDLIQFQSSDNIYQMIKSKHLIAV